MKNGFYEKQIENIAKSSKAVAILSTVVYHSAVRAGFVKNLIPLSYRNGRSSGRWPKLPWLLTDSWIRNSKGTIVPTREADFNVVPRADEV